MSEPAEATADVGPEAPSVANQIADLLRTGLLEAQEVTVKGVERVFGGNARHAWAASAEWTEASGTRRREPMIMLSRAPGSQVQVDPEREYAILRALHGTPVRGPKVWALDVEGTVTGTSSVLLQRMPGQADPVAFLNVDDERKGQELTTDLARAAAELHTVDVRRFRPDLAERLGAVVSTEERIDARATVAGQVEYWRSVFLECRLEPWPILSWLFDWLLDNLPKPATLAVVHGDLRPGNFLYEDTRLIALLDWEMAHLGDPVEDLAWIYRPLWSPRRFLGIDSFVHCYEEAGGPPVDPGHLLYHRVLAETKFATISLQAARAFTDGMTTNLRLADRAATVQSSLAHALDLVAELESQSKGLSC